MCERMLNIIVSCCVKNDNKILFVQENKKDVNGLWDLPGGKLKTTESIKQAAIREIMEETGYSIELKSILLMQNYITSKGEMLIIYFNAELLNEKQEKYIEEEIKNVKWFTIDEIKNIPKSSIRGGDGIDKILYNIEKKIEYPLEVLDIHNYLI
mgnify:FL=1